MPSTQTTHQFKYLKTLGTYRCQTCLPPQTAMTALEAYIFLNERMTLVQIVGSLVILSAVIIVSFEREKEPVLQPNRS
ncbi:MAG: DMT family transporter [Anaerolineae bacterium]